MIYVRYVLLGILVLLSLATGITKLIRMPEEMALFANAGFSELSTLIFGLVQVGGGLLLIFNRFRKIGAIIMTITFIIATIIVFVNGMIGFGIFSISFILLSAYFIKNSPFKSL